MALRKGVAYRNIEMPYTRKSRVRSKSYIKTSPGKKIVKYEMGNLQRKFPFRIALVSKEAVQVRDNAIEAARQTINRLLESKLGKNNYYFLIKAHPHHILREHKMLTGAGADRLQSGMKLSFGHPVGLAAQVFKGGEIFEVAVEKNGIEVVKDALHSIRPKLSCTTSIVIQSAEVVGVAG